MCECGLPPGECREHPRARPSQRPPAGDWRTWVVRAGRGHGKTKASCEWVRHHVETGKAKRVALVACTAADVRDVLVEGESGILACSPPWFRPTYEPSKRRLTWPNGAIATCYSAEEPERLRGPQHDLALCDELSVWHGSKTWDNLMLGLRLGTNPRTVVGMTPRPTALVKRLLAEPSTVETTGTTLDNRAHLAKDFINQIVSQYAGTRLGRQEVEGELLEILDGAWFTTWSTARHVNPLAEWVPGVKTFLAVDCGVSRCTGAVFFQAFPVDRYRTRFTCFADYYAEDLVSADNAMALAALAQQRCEGLIDLVLLDPASSARTGVGPAARGEYERIFGARRVECWPLHIVADGLDQVELLLGGENREPDLLVHPRCGHLVNAFNSYVRAQRAGEWLNHPQDPQHPSEDLIDSIRGGVRWVMPQGRKPQPSFTWVPASRAI